MNEPTIFSRIIDREIPAEILFSDEWITAFRDINPLAPVHILIVPNKAIATINDTDDSDVELLGRMWLVARDLAKQEGIAESGYRLVVNCNEHGGQEVFHLHLHLIGGKYLGRSVSR